MTNKRTRAGSAASMRRGQETVEETDGDKAMIAALPGVHCAAFDQTAVRGMRWFRPWATAAPYCSVAA